MTLNCKHCQISLASEGAGAFCPGCGRTLETENRIAFIADADRPFRAFMAEALSTLGFHVELFNSGEGLLERVRAERPALLLANVYLSGMLGVEICEKVKADETLPTRVLLIGAIFRPDRFKARPTSHYGADGYCEEGLSSDAFCKVVRNVMDSSCNSKAAAGEGRAR